MKHVGRRFRNQFQAGSARGRTLLASVAVAAATALHCASAGAQTSTPVFTIRTMITGWGNDQFLIQSTQAIVNPANCSYTDGYMSAIANPGYKAHYAAVLTAIAMGKPVWVVVDNAACESSRPKIIGIGFSTQ